jgi:Rab9 effector protein with kelch motifs
MNDVRFLNLENSEWKLSKATGEYIIPRKNHAACVLGKNMLIHGGNDIRDNFLKDIFLFEIGNIN